MIDSNNKRHDISTNQTVKGNTPMMIKTYLRIYRYSRQIDIGIIFRIFAQKCNLPFEKQRHIMIHDHVKIFIDITTYAIKLMASKIK